MMLPDERVIDLDEGLLGTVAPSYYSWEWPRDDDEVVYAVADGEGWVLRRTVLP